MASLPPLLQTITKLMLLLAALISGDFSCESQSAAKAPATAPAIGGQPLSFNYATAAFHKLCQQRIWHHVKRNKYSATAVFGLAFYDTRTRCNQFNAFLFKVFCLYVCLFV